MVLSGINLSLHYLFAGANITASNNPFAYSNKKSNCCKLQEYLQNHAYYAKPFCNAGWCLWTHT
jgi:hypothetical protein